MSKKALLSIVGGAIMLFGTETVKITSWDQAITPLYVGLLAIQIGGLLAVAGGALYTDVRGAKLRVPEEVQG